MPMFQLESEMAPSVARWLSRAGMQVRPQFVTPWGICDLAAIEFRSEGIAQRVRLRQFKPVSSITRAAILLRVPDVDTSQSVSIHRLAKHFSTCISASVISAEVERLLADRFLIRTSRGKLQKINGWTPLHKRLVAIELKLNRIDEAFQQANRNLGFAEESYVAFPMALAMRLQNMDRWGDYFKNGVGLLGVTKRTSKVLVSARASNQSSASAVQVYCVDKFWRTRGRKAGFKDS
jgi:hypothetical protein